MAGFTKGFIYSYWVLFVVEPITGRQLSKIRKRWEEIFRCVELFVALLLCFASSVSPPKHSLLTAAGWGRQKALAWLIQRGSQGSWTGCGLAFLPGVCNCNSIFEPQHRA